MEKLELKYLAPYLPYGLKFYWEDLKGNINEPWSLTINSIDFALENQNKPILRPLSDLTKEITHNGEKFIPIDYFVGDDSDLVYNACLIHNDFSYLPYNLVQLLLEWHFDIFGLIEKGLAIDINTLK